MSSHVGTLYSDSQGHLLIRFSSFSAKSKKEAIQFVKDRLHWDLEDFDYSSDSYQVREVSLLKKLPINLKDEATAEWWEKVKESRKNWINNNENLNKKFT